MDRAVNKLKCMVSGIFIFIMTSDHSLTGEYKNAFDWSAGESTGIPFKHNSNKTAVLRNIADIRKNWLNRIGLFFAINAGMGVRFAF